MSVEMPQWCGRCNPATRRFDLGDSERRCAECNPFWAFGHSTVDSARVPGSPAEQEQAARWLLYEVVGLRSLEPAELRRRTRRFFEAGWTPQDVLHALDNDPDGSPARSVPLPGDPPDRMERQILNLLSAWCDADGEPLPSPSQLAMRRRHRAQERQRAQQEAWAQIAARPVDPSAAERSGARQVAAQATRRAQEMRAEARRREKARLAASADVARAQEERLVSLMERLDRLTRSIASPQRAWEADWAIVPREALVLHDIEPYYSVDACEEEPFGEPEPVGFTCEAEIDDTVPWREAGLRMIRARRNDDAKEEVSPSVVENETAVGRSQWTSMRGSTRMSAGRSGGPRRRAA
jgi:hypothetical protein